MSDDLAFKILSEFKPQFRNKKVVDDQVVHFKTLYGTLDKLIIDLNKGFVPKLDKQFDNLTSTIGDDQTEGTLKQQLKELRDEVDGLKLPKKEIDPTNEDEWAAPTHSDIL